MSSAFLEQEYGFVCWSSGCGCETASKCVCVRVVCVIYEVIAMYVRLYLYTLKGLDLIFYYCLPVLKQRMFKKVVRFGDYIYIYIYIYTYILKR